MTTRATSFRSAFFPSRDIVGILAAVFATLVLGFFPATAPWIVPLRLSSAVLTDGHIWQLVSYPFAAVDGESVWIVAQFLLLFMFSRDLWLAIGRRRFWLLLLSVAAAAGFIAVVLTMAGIGATKLPLMQGQVMLLTIVMTAYAAYHGSGRVTLVALPVRADWLLVPVILLPLVQFASVPDTVGLIGRLSAVAMAWTSLRPGALGRVVRRIGRRWRIERIRRHGLHVVTDEPENPDRWVH